MSCGHELKPGSVPPCVTPYDNPVYPWVYLYTRADRDIHRGGVCFSQPIARSQVIGHTARFSSTKPALRGFVFTGRWFDRQRFLKAFDFFPDIP